MAFSITKFLKGLLISEAGTNTPKEILIIPGGTVGTKTTVTSSQTIDRIITLPDSTDILIGRTSIDTLTNKILTNAILNDSQINLLLAAEQGVTPSTPAAGYRKFYAKAGGLYDLNSAGVETLLGSGGGGGGANTSLSNLVALTTVNVDLLPQGTINDQSLGRNANRWNQIWSSGIIVTNSKLQMVSGLDIVGNKISGSGDGSALELSSPSIGNGPILLDTGTSNSGSLNTANINVTTGDKTGGTGNSGNINLTTGASSVGSRGKIVLDALEIDATNKKITNVATPTNPNDAVNKAYADSLSGGGAPNIVQSGSSSNFNITQPGISTTALVTNLTVTITTTGKPINVYLQSFDGTGGGGVRISDSANPGGAAGINLSFLRNGVVVNSSNLLIGAGGATAIQLGVPASSFSFTDIGLAPGTYTYTVQVQTVLTVIVNNVKLVAYELK